jgi:hypothetical protein
MRKAVAVKIAEHLATIAAPARVKRALDRYIEKKAIALTDRPMAYGAGLGALGGGALMGGSTAIANMFRKKEDRKSVLDNTLLGAAGGGALGLSGGAMYHGLYGDPAKKPKSSVIPDTPATPDEIKARLNNPNFEKDVAANKLEAKRLHDAAAALPGSHDPNASDFDPNKARAMELANAANSRVNYDVETATQRDAKEQAASPLYKERGIIAPSLAVGGGFLGGAAGIYGGANIDFRRKLEAAYREAQKGGNVLSSEFGTKLRGIMGSDAAVQDSSQRHKLFKAVADQSRLNWFQSLREKIGLPPEGTVDRNYYKKTMLDRLSDATNKLTGGYLGKSLTPDNSWRPSTAPTPDELKQYREHNATILKAEKDLAAASKAKKPDAAKAKAEEALTKARAAFAADKAKFNAKVQKIQNMPSQFAPSELMDMTTPSTKSRNFRAVLGAGVGASAIPTAQWAWGKLNSDDLNSQADLAAKRTADNFRALNAVYPGPQR